MNSKSRCQDFSVSFLARIFERNFENFFKIEGGSHELKITFPGFFCQFFGDKVQHKLQSLTLDIVA